MTDWGRKIRLSELERGPIQLRLEPDAAARAAIAQDLGLESLPALTAEVTIRPWLDGATLLGRFQARVEQISSISLDPFEQDLSATFEVAVVPAGSPNVAEEAGETNFDPEAPDPPDVLEGEVIDPSAYLVEHLALELDPFPRQPGEEFAFDAGDPDDSPFAALKALKNQQK